VFQGILVEAQQTVLELLSRLGEVRTFYLAGGTALALHLGHRRSSDFDFFAGRISCRRTCFLP
jgi:nucleotidyltransferase AbiEii toxin of type IV toxin-antitoxin system